MIFSSFREFQGFLPYLIDARFRRDAFVLDDRTRVFKIDCWMPSKCKPRVGKNAYMADNTEWTRISLHFQSVSTCEAKVNDDVSYYEIGSFFRDEKSGRLVIVGHYGITIELRIEGCRGGILILDDQLVGWSD